MEPRQLLTILQERWRSALLVGFVVLAAVAAATAVQTPMYESTTRTFVQPQSGASVDELNTGIVLAGQQITSYSDLVTTPLVLDPVVEELDLATTSDDLSERITATVRPDTLIIEISAKDEDPERAAALADATAASLGARLADLGSSSGTPAIGLTVVSPANPSTTPASPSIPMNAAIGLVLALAVAVTIAMLREHVDNRVRRVEDVEKVVDHPVIAAVPTVRDTQSAPLITSLSYEGPQSEAYRSLRTNLQFMTCTSESRSLLITSALPGEGKSSTAINLAAVFAQAGKRVLLIDADLRRPSVAAYTGLEGSAGLTTVLTGSAELADVVQPMRSSGLDVLASGVIPPNPSELLASPRMGELLAEAEAQYDQVILDTSPVLAVTDPVVLAPRVGGTVMVARSDRTRRPQLQTATDRLTAVDAKVCGIVLNRVHRGRAESYDYEYVSSPPTGSSDLGHKSSGERARTSRLEEGAARVARRYEPAVEAR